MRCEKKHLKFNKAEVDVYPSNYSPAICHIKENITRNFGICIDVGSCDSTLGIEMAKITDMSVYLLDKSEDLLNIKVKEAENTGLRNRIKPLPGDVHNIPMKDQSVDLIVSKNPIWFWKDPIRAFKEIYRVLSPEGIAYVEGDLQINTVNNNKKEKSFSKKRKKVNNENVVEKLVNILISANIRYFAVTQDDLGPWIILKKAV